MIYAWLDSLKEMCKDIRHLFRAFACKRVVYYRGIRWCDSEYNYKCDWLWCDKRSGESVDE